MSDSELLELARRLVNSPLNSEDNYQGHETYRLLNPREKLVVLAEMNECRKAKLGLYQATVLG